MWYCKFIEVCLLQFRAVFFGRLGYTTSSSKEVVHGKIGHKVATIALVWGMYHPCHNRFTHCETWFPSIVELGRGVAFEWSRAALSHVAQRLFGNGQTPWEFDVFTRCSRFATPHNAEFLNNCTQYVELQKGVLAR